MATGNDANGASTPAFLATNVAQPAHDLEHDEAITDADGFETPEHEEPTQHRETAYYDYETDKQYSHADAKWFYQRHQLAQRGSRASQTASTRDEVLPERPAKASTFGPSASHAHFDGFSHEIKPERSGLQQGVSSPSALPADPMLPDSVGQFQQQHSSIGMDFSGEAGPGSFANQDPEISSELVAICSKIQKILDLRHKYIRLSLQRGGDNPKDDSRWRIYPDPPKPVWHDSQHVTAPEDSGESQPGGLQNSQTLSMHDGDPTTPARKPRKPGQDIGGDFFLEDLMPVPEESEMVYRLDENGVYQVYENDVAAEHNTPILAVPTLRDYYIDLDAVLSISSNGPAKSFAFRRLQYLEGKYNLYFLLHEYQEITDSKKVPHRDFYNVRKVDTHVHHSACMNQKHLLRFIKSKMKKCPEEFVLRRDGKDLTLREVFESINLTAYDLSIDTLDMHAHTDSFHRFDKFNLKYNPIGESRLRTIFLKTDNDIGGRYLAELTKEVISDLESSKYQMVEWRISIYGRNLQEWDKLAAWVVDNKLYSHNVRWLIQVPRLYDVYKAAGNMESYEEIVRNIFQPLFEVTKNPSSNAKLHVFLQRVVGFDSVDDESKAERRIHRKFPRARDWTGSQSPPYSYWIYYLFANMTSLNAWRKQRGFNTFVLRPHCGEAGETDHLAAAVLCSHSINHGILLRKTPVLQYIFYLEQIGIAMSPLSNNALFLAYERNPFPNYFKRGLNVSLSTDDPLQFAYTKEPLIEEYSVAAQIYKLNAVDMCELAKNSVLQSGFEHALKKQWLGSKYHMPGQEGNNVAKSNVPNIRTTFRHETLMQELTMINRYTTAGSQGQPVSSETLPPPAIETGDSQAPPSPTASMHTDPSHVFLQQQRRRSIKVQPGSVAAISGVEHGSPLLIGRAPWHAGGSGAQVASPNTALPAGEAWLGGMSEPKNFPGVIQERTRRDTMPAHDGENEQ